MKKQEAIELIAKRLGPVGICEETCNEVLDLLLEAGMLPPMTKKKISRDFNGSVISWDKDVREWDD